MAKINTVLTIDIGGCSIKVAEFVFPENGGMELSQYEFMEYPISDSDSSFLQNFTDAITTVFATGKFQSKQVRLSISGQNFFTRLSMLPPVTEKRSHVEQIIEFEARQTVPYPMEEVVWDYQLIRSSLGGGDDGLGMAEEMEALFVAVKNDLLSSITDVIEDFGKEILSVEIAPTAFYNAAIVNGIGREQCEVILNIGGRCSNLVFVDHGRIFARTIPIAGHSITQQIAKEFNIPFEDAEELKRRHCFVALGGAYEEPDSQVAATISKIARNVMTRLHGEINRSINVWRSQHAGNKPARMFLCGGSSIIPYTPHFFNEKLRIPVEYLNAFQVVTLNPGLDRKQLVEDAPLLPDIIGLGLRHAVNCPVEISLLPKSVRFQQVFKHKRLYFYFSIALVFFCLLVIYQMAGLHMKRAHEEKNKVEDSVKAAQADSEVVNRVNNELRSVTSSYERVHELINQREQWLRVMAELEKIKPENVWFTSVLPGDADVVTVLEPVETGYGMMGPGGIGMPPGGMPPGGMPPAVSPVGDSVSMPVGGGMGGYGYEYEEIDPSVLPGEKEYLTEVAYLEVIGHWVYDDIASDKTINNLKDNIKRSAIFEIEDQELHLSEQSGADQANVGEFRVLLRFIEPITL